MPDLAPVQADDTRFERPRRLNQIALWVLTTQLVTGVVYLVQGTWWVSLALLLGVLSMLLCLWLNMRGRYAAAATVLLTAATLLTSALMWMSEGLKDVALLGYPVILVVAGLLGNPRQLLALVLAMLVYLGALALATHVLHWRVDSSPSPWYSVWRDASAILLVGAAGVWIIGADLRKALVDLRQQVRKYDASQEELAHLARHDTLTQLANRSTGRQRIEQAIELAQRHGHRLALPFIDLDEFKEINDTLGHHAGDEVLREVSQRLLAAVRKSDIVARFGGDEFVIGLSEVRDVADASNVASALLARLSQPLVVIDTELSCTASIGIALYPDDGASYDEILQHADMAMYRAKELSHNSFRFFNRTMQSDTERNLLLVTSLRAALQRGDFVLHYQPVFDLVGGRLRGAEALVRWQRSPGDLVAPGQFIEAAERSGLIFELGTWVLGEAARQCAEWQRRGASEMSMAVNLSVVQFRRGDVHEVVGRALDKTGLAPGCLEVEITESTLVQDKEEFVVALERLKALGVRIAIDDFGTGYSNLAYLQRFDIDTLKIDRSFVCNLHRSVQDRAIIHAIIQMARSLGLRTTAEGVEGLAAAQELASMGCDTAQGFLFGRPVPAAVFEQNYLTGLAPAA